MDRTAVTTSALSLIAGVGIFLIACNMMSSNLEALGSKKLKALFAKTSKSKLAGVGVGAAATAVMQSSSATSVMVIGFVNAGIMTLTQAATVIFGANIGTTVTGQLVALGMFGDSSLSSSAVFAAFAGIGAFILSFAKKDRVQKLGGIMAGFGMLFAGLTIMSGAMGYFSELQEVKDFLALFENPLLLVLTGAVLTAVAQSSSVMTSMTITTVVSGLISLNQGVYLTMGANVGTCVTAMIAGLTSTVNAKRTALIHLIFNLSGTVVFMLTGLFLNIGGTDFGNIFSAMFPNAVQIQLAMFHTVFNLFTVIIALPLTNLLVKLVTKLVPDKKSVNDKNGGPRFYFVEEHMLTNPPVAVQQTKREILNMAKIAKTNFDISIDIICNSDYGKEDEFRKNEKQLNFLNAKLAEFIAKLLKADLSEKDRLYLSASFRTITDLERVGDYAENIVEYAEQLKDYGKEFSRTAKNEIRDLQNLIGNLCKSMLKAYSENDFAALKSAYATEEKVDGFTAGMTENHIKRLSDNSTPPEVGALYLSLFANAERVADHFINVAKSIKSFV